MIEPDGKCENTFFIFSAEPTGDAVIPDGSVQLFVLTSGEALNLISVAESPAFALETEGFYTIHSLVVPDDPVLLDGINALIAEGTLKTGGDVLTAIDMMGICADLDVSGASIEVEQSTIDDCEDTPCEITADPMDPVSKECEDGNILLKAKLPEGAELPAGYTRFYVLTKSEALNLRGVSPEPQFFVNEVDEYRIHQVIIPIDTSLVEEFVTLVEDGGITTTKGAIAWAEEQEICFAIDSIGALFEVTEDDIEECAKVPCPAEAGTLKVKEMMPDTCFSEAVTSIRITAEVDEEGIVPQGYGKAFVLTRGLDLELISLDTIPSFEIKKAGLYTIHSVVIPLNTSLFLLVEPLIEAGELETASDLIDLLEEANICYSLDVKGAQFELEDCKPPVVVTECILDDWKDDGVQDMHPPYDHALFLMTSPADPQNAQGINTHEQRFVWEEPGVWTQKGDTATITGTVVNKVDTSMKICIYFKVYDPMSWEEWEAKGGTYMADNQTDGQAAVDNFKDWQYWMISSQSELIGKGSLEGVRFTIEQFPADKALQLGVGANDKDGSLGIGAWFNYEGEYNGMTLSGMGDINVDIVGCIEKVHEEETPPAADSPSSKEFVPGFTLIEKEEETVEYEVFPNPASHSFTIAAQQPDKVQQGLYIIRLSDINGRTVYQRLHESYTGTHEIRIESFSAGVYLLRITEPNGNEVLKRISLK